MALGGQAARLGGVAVAQVAQHRARQEGVQRLAHPRRRRILMRRYLRRSACGLHRGIPNNSAMGIGGAADSSPCSPNALHRLHLWVSFRRTKSAVATHDVTSLWLYSALTRVEKPP